MDYITIEKLFAVSDILEAFVDLDHPTFVWVKDIELKYVYMGRYGIEIIGLPKESIIGLKDRDFLSNKAYSVCEYEDIKVIKSLRRLSTYMEVTYKDKDYIFETQKIPILSNGRCKGILGVATDVTLNKLLITKNSLVHAQLLNVIRKYLTLNNSVKYVANLDFTLRTTLLLHYLMKVVYVEKNLKLTFSEFLGIEAQFKKVFDIHFEIIADQETFSPHLYTCLICIAYLRLNEYYFAKRYHQKQVIIINTKFNNINMQFNLTKILKIDEDIMHLINAIGFDVAWCKSTDKMWEIEVKRI